MNKINDIDIYNKRMSMSLNDKLWFVSELNNLNNVNIIVDFGCADGNLISELASKFKDILFIGYDNSLEMIELCNEKCSYLNNTYFTNEWKSVVDKMKSIENPNSCLVLSSVIHEVFSLNDYNVNKEFWENVTKSDFNYIAIRDMACYNDFDLNHVVEKIRAKARNDKQLSNMLIDFQKHWGNISNSHVTALHFLLKYRYIENWNREVCENYLPINLSDSENINKFRENGYEECTVEKYALPFLVKTFKNDFDIDFKGTTHNKFLWKKRY